MKQIIFLFFNIYALYLIAQPVLSGVDISVKEKYKAEVAQAIKITGQPSIRDTNVEKLSVDIELRSRTLIPSSEMELIPSIKIARTKLYRLPSNTVMLAAGNYSTTRAGFAIGNARSPVITWGLQGHHFSTFSGFKSKNSQGQQMSVFKNASWFENGLSGHYNRVIGRGRLLTRASADWNRYSFYGQPLVDGFNDADTIKKSPGRWIQDYQAEGTYMHSGNRRKQIFQSAHVRSHHWIDQGGRQVETGVYSALEWRLPVQDIFIELPFITSLNRLSGTARIDTSGELISNTFWSAQFVPAISDSIGNLSFKIGLNIIFTGLTANGNMVDRPYLPPIMHAEFPLVKNVLNVYFGLDGGAENDGMRSRVDQVPFLASSTEYQVVRKSSIYGGANGRLSSSVGYRFGARVRSYENYAMTIRNSAFIPSVIDSGRLFLEYIKMKSIEPSGELTFQNGLGWELRGFALLRFVSRPEDVNEKVYHLPESQIGCQILFNLKDKIRFESTVIRHGERWGNFYGQDTRLDSYLDGRFSVVYTYNDQLNATFRIDNIFNSRTSWWSGYAVQGRRANLGLVYKF